MSNTSITVKTTMQIKIPQTPNFIRSPGRDDVIPIEDFTPEQLREIGKEWTDQLVHKANKLKQEKCKAWNKKMGTY